MSVAYECARCEGRGMLRGGLRQDKRGRWRVCKPSKCVACNGAGELCEYYVGVLCKVAPETVRAIARGVASARSCRTFLRHLPPRLLAA